MKKVRIVGIVGLLILLSSFQLEAKTSKVVEVEGLGTITNNNLAAAKEKAINDGLRRAVEQVVGTYINSSTKIKKAQLIKDKILKSSQGYVEKYIILNKRMGQKIYRVKLRVKVSTKDLTSDLEALELNIKRHGNPRLIILVEQKDNNYSLNLSSKLVENQMMNNFIKAGYQVIDRYRIEKIIDREQKQAIVRGDYDLAAKLGTKLKSDLVIIGEARLNKISLKEVYEGEVAGILASYQGRINAKVINTSTAQVIAAITRAGKEAGENQEAAARKALIKVTETVTKKLVNRVSESVIQEERTIELKISGIDSITNLNKIKSNLSSVTGVKSAYFREYNNGLAIFNIDLYSSAQILSLAAELKKKTNLEFNIITMSSSKLTLEVQ